MVVARLTTGLAIAGGGLVLALAIAVTASVLSRWLAGRNLPGDFELVQIGISLATFAFLPLCHLRGGNVVVDTFTRRLPVRARAALDALWQLVYLAIALLLVWRMGAGAVETLASGTTSMVLGLPIGWAILAATALCAWLAVVLLTTTVAAARAVRR